MRYLSPSLRSLLYAACLSGFFIIGSPVLAQTVHEVAPRAIEHEVLPGDIVEETVVVTNTYSYRINVFPSVHGLSSKTATNTIVTVSDETPFMRWITMSRAAQRLDPGESTEVAVRFTIPRDIEPGIYHGLLGFGQGIDRPTAEAAVIRGSAPGVVLRFAVPEPRVDTASAAHLSLQRFVLSPQQAALSYTIQNPTSKSVVPTGEIVFVNNRGAEVASVSINAAGTVVEPGTVFSVATTTPGLGLLGAYEARARVNFADTQLASIALTDSFWYVPWYMILMLLVSIVVLSLLLYRFLHRTTARTSAASDGSRPLPLHVYQGESPAEQHDINLKSR